MRRAAIALALAATLAACRAAPEFAPAPPAAAGGHAPAAGAPLDPAFEPALAALAQAVAAHEDELAQRILSGLLARQPRGAALEQALGWQRVLRGRALQRQLDCTLEARALPDAPVPGLHCELVLVLRSRAPEPLELELPPAELACYSLALNEAGFEARAKETRATPGVRQRLEPGARAEFALARYALPVGNAIGLRAHWRLEPRAGTVRLAHETLALSLAPAASVELVCAGSYLPSEAVAPEEFARYAQLPRVLVAPPLERAVRLAPSEWERALELVARAEPPLTPEQLVPLAPALRWLSRGTDHGVDGLAWRRWLDARFESAPPTEPAAPGLELPAGLPNSSEGTP
jgi:hypothetical protein